MPPVPGAVPSCSSLRLGPARLGATLGRQLRPAGEPAGPWRSTVVIFDAAAPRAPEVRRRQACQQRRVLRRNAALVIITIERPGLHLAAIELTTVQQAMEWMQDVVARGADVPQFGFKLVR